MWQELLIQIATLKNYKKETHDPLFIELLTKLHKEGMDPGSVFVRRFLALIQRGTVEQALQILTFIESYLTVPLDHKMEEKARAKIRAAINLLSECPIHLTTLLQLYPEGKLECEVEEKAVDMSRITTLIARGGSFRTQPSCEEKTITQESKLEDSPLQQLQKCLFQHHIHVDRGGHVYKHSHRAAIGSGSSYDIEIPVISLVEGIDYELIRRYFVLIEALKAGVDMFFETFILYDEMVSLIFPQHHEKFSELIKVLPPQYSLQHSRRLNDIFQQDQLCQAILEDKGIFTAFEKVPLIKTKLLMPEKHLFFLHLFYLKSNTVTFETLWPQGAFIKLQRMVESLIAADFGHSDTRDCPPALIRIMTANGKDDNIRRIWTLMNELPGHFETTFIFKFCKQYIGKTEAEVFLKKTYDLHCATPEAQVRWLQSFDKSIANEFLTLFEQNKLKIFYMAILNGTDLQEIEVIRSFAQRYLVAPIEHECVSETDPEEKKLNQTVLNAIKNKTYSSDTIRLSMQHELSVYRTHYLKAKGHGEYEGQGFLIPNERGMAYKELATILLKEDYCWNHFKNLYRQEKFRKNAGCVINHLIKPAYSLWPLVQMLHDNIAKQEAIFKLDDAMLTEVMSKDIYYKVLSKEECVLIFNHSNRSLFIDLIVKYNRLEDWQEFVVQPADQRSLVLTSGIIAEMVRMNEGSDYLRHQFCINMAPDFKKPGIESSSEELSPLLAYQFEEGAMNTAEYSIVREYKHLLCNKWDSKELNVEGKREEKGEQEAKLTFFYVPVSLHPVIVDPEEKESNHYSHYVTYKKTLKDLVDSYQPIEHKKPVIFCGIVNVNANHYVPFFIYKKPNNAIQVICVNPSPQFKKWLPDSPLKNKCPKQVAIEKFIKIFNDIFPTCEFSDPGVTQQLRQRDCGPNSLTVIEDALRTAETANPLLEVNGTQLVLHEKRLSVNFNNLRRYHMKEGIYYYSPMAQNLGNQNRFNWVKRLRHMREAFLSVGKLGSTFSIHADCTLISLMEEDKFNISDLAVMQSRSDKLGELRNKWAAIIEMGTELPNSKFNLDIHAVREEFKQTLTLPIEDKRINDYIAHLKNEFYKLVDSKSEKTAKDALHMLDSIRATEEETKKAHQSVASMVRDVLALNVKDYFSEAILFCFNQFVRSFPINHTHKFHDIIEAYLTKPPAAPYFEKLISKEKEIVVEKLKKDNLARKTYEEKSIASHIAFISFEKLKPTLSKLLQDIPADFIRSDLLSHIINHFKTDVVVKNSFILLEEYDLPNLHKIMQAMIDQLLLKSVRAVLCYLQDKMEVTTLDALPKPSERGISILSPTFFTLLPTGLIDKNKEQEDVPIQSDLIVEVKGTTKESEKKFNVFAHLLSTRMDEKLSDLFNRIFNRLLMENIAKKFVSDDTQLKISQFSLGELSKVLLSTDYAQQIGVHFNLYDLLTPISAFPKLYHSAHQELTRLFCLKIKEVLQMQFDSIFTLLTTKYVLIGKENLTLLFSNLMHQQHEIQLIQLINNFIRSTGITIDEYHCLSKLVGPANVEIFTTFSQLNAQAIIEKFKKIELDVVNVINQTTQFQKLIEAIETRLEGMASTLIYEKERESKESKSSSLSESMQNVSLGKAISTRGIASELKEIQQAAEEARYVLDYQKIVFDCTERLTKNLQHVLTLLNHQYQIGDVGLGRHTVRARILLCHLLQIPLNGKLYFTREEALILDSEIQRQTHVAKPLQLKLDLPFATLPLPRHVVPTMEVIGTYNKPITSRLLCQLIANWQFLIEADLVARKKEKENMSSTIGFILLCDALNYIPSEAKDDEALPMSWCKQYIESIFTNPRVQNEMRQNKMTEECMFALSNCVVFKSCDEQKAEVGKAILLSRVEDVLALYLKQEKRHTFDEYYMRLTPQLAVAPTAMEAKFHRGKFRGLFHKVTSDITHLENCINAIKRHHGVLGDFTLDKSDIICLQELLVQRWKRLCSESKSSLPENYLKPTHATDCIYLLLASILRDALSHFGIIKPAYDLLMPGRVKEGMAEMKEAYPDEFSITADIDDYHYGSIIILPDRGWFPSHMFVKNYLDGKGLMDVFSRAPLRSSDVQYIVEHYPQVADELLPRFIEVANLSPIRHPRVYNILLTFLKEGYFVEGVDGHYTEKHKKAFPRAVDKLYISLSQLSDLTRQMLYKTLVPLENRTLGDVFQHSGSSCVTIFGTAIARALWKNCPHIPLEDFGSGIVSAQEKHEIFEGIERDKISDIEKDITVSSTEEPLLRYYLKSCGLSGQSQVASARITLT